jgi:polyhydroxyalkanoate synthesis regulator phasin
VNDTWQKYVDMASGLTQVTRQRAEQVVRSLVKQGELAADSVEKNVEELLRRSEDNRKAVMALVRSETERAVSRLGLARKRDIDRLQNKVERLEAKVSGGPAKKAAKKSAAAKRAAGKKTAKKAQKRTGKKSSRKAAKKAAKKS